VNVPIEVKILAILAKTTVLIILTVVCILSIILKAQIKDRNWRNHGFFEHATTKIFKILFHYPMVHIALQVFLFLFTAYFFSHEIAELYGVLNRADRPDDFRWYYTASKMVRDGTSPYVIEDFSRYLLPLIRTEREIGPFIYPPNTIPFMYPLSYFSFSVSAKLFSAANFLGAGFLLFGAVKLVSCQTRGVTFSCFCIFSIIVGVTNSLFLGNIATMVVPCIVWTYIFAQRHRDGLAGLLLGISTVKPTLSIFFVMYFLIMKKFSLIFWCIITSSSLMLIGLFMSHTSIYNFLSLYRLGSDLFF
jgi:Glycosyltransferase family 87